MISGDRMFGRTIMVHMFICLDDTLFTGAFKLDISIGSDAFKELKRLAKNNVLHKLGFVRNIALGRRGASD